MTRTKATKAIVKTADTLSLPAMKLLATLNALFLLSFFVVMGMAISG